MIFVNVVSVDFLRELVDRVKLEVAVIGKCVNRNSVYGLLETSAESRT